MNYVLLYWIIGCVFIGSSLGVREDKCPDEEHTAASVVAQVSVWPALITWAIVSQTPMKCRNIKP